MMKMAFKSLLSCRFLPHSSAAVSSYCVTRVDSHFHLFSTITNHNPKPKPPFIASSSRPHAQLQQLLYDKSKIGFDNLDDALFVFHKMLNMKPLLSVMKFNQLLVALVRMQKYSVAVSMFRELRVLCIPVNIVTFNTIIKCCCCHLNNTLDYAFSLLGGMIKSGLVPNVVTYTTLIKGLLSQDRPVDAEHLFKKLLTFNEVQPNVVTYSIVIDGLCKTSNTSMAVELFRNMEKKGCIPNIVTYTTIIDSLCKDRHVDQAMSLFF
ncbi:Pentatricopeptide repeat-containing protein [Heracleum sosnowskyi]|uniref:Pentatricopeptide repeat-containing protein n=1 Tax=Heracleum sosnowskyi TaxID=360622 RepID=A0AAD8GMN0_9APIA|nr:Pentatricopeptide repeat-containing protein [Heracleum sosnowskyi]